MRLFNYKLFCESLSEQEEIDYFNTYSEDIHELFFDYVKRYQLTTKTAQEMFRPGTDFFVIFIESLENYSWFDYRKLSYFLKEWDQLINSIDDMREEGIFDDDENEIDDEETEY
jgi:hypothetical protein